MKDFHKSIARWFDATFPAPTDVQRLSWPRIAAGAHLLITAPTGSGKTLTAFLWSLNRFARGELATGATRVLYISPLKALNNDIQRNLLAPLAELRDAGDFPEIRVQTRSGDTPQNERQRMLRRPPEILITTPESLFLLLTNRRGSEALASIETVIVDEIHSIVDSRRGVQLMTSLERLADIAGEFQRIALSATVRPLAAVAGYVGGFAADGHARELEIIEAPGAKDIDFRVHFPEAARSAAQQGEPIWNPLSDAFRQHISANASTLLFTNSRSLAEKITFKLNENRPSPLAYAHHGSLARDIRTTVEARLKAGELKAIVATSSLEMGIDIGHLDEVLLVQSPGSVAATLQRIGRAGHRVGETSRGSLYPTHAIDFIEAAVLARAVADRDIEPLQLMQGALDVLAQIIVSCCAHQSVSTDQLHALLTRSSPYHELSREQFELVLEMLAGRYAGARIRELKARVHYDRIARTVKAHRSALFALYNSGGTIPDRGYYKLRHAESGAELGELDEEFVWEAKLGQVFSLGTQNWQVQRITHNDVLVRPAKPDTLAPPFWRSEVINRSYHYSERIGEFLEDTEHQLTLRQADEFHAMLIAERGFDEIAARELVEYLQQQRKATGSALPHRHHLLFETVHTGPGGYRGPDDIAHLVIHTFWGGQVNRPWALAIEAAWQQKFCYTPEIHADNNAISIQLREAVSASDVLGLVTPDNLLGLLRLSLEGSGFFGARFRECAGRALLLTRQRFDARLPLWMSRLQAKKLMSQVAQFTDFPVLLESWRTCLNDEFDLPALMGLLEELLDGVISFSAVNSATPSPLAGNLTFDTVSRYMYADDSPEGNGASSLADELIEGALSHAHLRPEITADTVDTFVSRRQRLLPGYQPDTAEEWQDWLKERILLPADEVCDELEAHADGCWIDLDGRRWLAHPESLPALTTSGLLAGATVTASFAPLDDPRSELELCLEILSFYPPLSSTQISQLLPRIPAGLLEDDALISGTLLAGDSTERYCDRANFEALLRIQRASRRPAVEARPQTALAPFLASWQGFNRSVDDDAMAAALTALRGYPAAPGVWLEDLLSARFPEFSDHQLDDACNALELIWFGTGREQVTLGYPEDMELLTQSPEQLQISELFTDPGAGYGFFALADRQPDGLTGFNETFWQAVWNGQIYCDSLSALRQAAQRRFRLTDNPSAVRAQSTLRRSPRRRMARPGQGWPGTWYLRPRADADTDPLTLAEDNKDRARILLDRYGLVCRELANREGGSMRWARIARSLFAMELAGEIVSGYFFTGLSGPQFMTPAALAHFVSQRTVGSFWLNATDPASPCALGSEHEDLPSRRPQNTLSFHAGSLALVSENSGRRLRFEVGPEHPAMAEICAPLLQLVRRRRRFTVELINDQNTAESPYLPVLSRLFTPVRDHKNISFEVR